MWLLCDCLCSITRNLDFVKHYFSGTSFKYKSAYNRHRTFNIIEERGNPDCATSQETERSP